MIEADVLRFPISLLTTVAIMDGISQRAHRYSYEVQRDRPSGTHDRITHTDCCMTNCLDFCEEQTRKEIENVLCEMQTLLGASDVSHLPRYFKIWTHFDLYTVPPPTLSAVDETTRRELSSYFLVAFGVCFSLTFSFEWSHKDRLIIFFVNLEIVHKPKDTFSHVTWTLSVMD